MELTQNLQAKKEAARELADMIGNEVMECEMPIEVLTLTACYLNNDYRKIIQAAEDIKEEEKATREIIMGQADGKEKRQGMGSNRAEKYTVAYRNVKRCKFHDIGTHIVVTSVIGGTTFCAFFETGKHTVESIKRRGSIKLHSIYSKK